jgi:hypothetical protein
MTTLIEFLRARLDEDEGTAREAWAPNWPDPLSWLSEEELVGRLDGSADIEGFATAGSKADARHVARHDPTRVLADVAARRAILDLCEAGIDPETPATPGTRAAYRAILGYMAAPHDTRPDYNPAWQPAEVTT